MVRLYDGNEAMELERASKELDTYIVSWLRNPYDAMTRQSLGLVRARQQYAAARVQERLLRAPRAGIVSDIRVLPGQRVMPGETVVSLVMEGHRISVIALLPGNQRPQLRAGMALRLELAGYRGSSREMIIESIGNELIGPAAARRYLGPEIADAVPLTGPVVIVEASAPASTFEADGATYEYHDGMQGLARVRMRSERIISALFPSLTGTR